MKTELRPCPGGREQGTARLGAPAALITAAVALLATPASAAPTTLSIPTPFSGETSLGSTSFVAESVVGVTLDGEVHTWLEWGQPADLDATIDPALLREGRDVDPQDAYVRTGSGQMAVSVNVGDLDISWGIIGPLDLPDFTLEAFDGACDLAAGGGAYECNLTGSRVALFPIPAGAHLVGPFVDLRISATVTVTPEAIEATRTATFGGNPGGTVALSLSEAPITDDLAIPCTLNDGDELVYTLGSLSTSPGVNVETRLEFVVGTAIPTPIPGVTVDIDFASPDYPLDAVDAEVAMTGADAVFEMGEILANNIPPSIPALGPFSGNEGAPIAFSAAGTTSQCPIASHVWQFSNGTTSFGPAPQRAFGDDATYDGQLTATDVSGLSATRSFTVGVSNLLPVVNAGPDDMADWGRTVQFTGQATDPGSGDQPTLHYTWDFGDGTPSASGGPNVAHAYALPNAAGYTATLTVCDDHGCASDTRKIIVTPRGTTTSYTGDLAWTHDTAGTLSAALVDEYGQSVSGRSIAFQVGGEAPLSASTSGAGVASRSHTPLLGAGSYAGTATFAGDSMYEASAAPITVAIARKATAVTYTGPTGAGPNKTITLSAVLKDATGKPLAGRTITFQLGTQSVVSGPADANGVAIATLKLDQKLGTYSLSATYTPVDGDAPLYLGSSAATTFKLK